MTNRFRTIAGVAFVAATLVGAGSAHAQEIKLRWAHYLPDSPFLDIEERFADAIEERSGGRVSIEFFYAGSLGGGDEVLTLTGRGAVDMASGVPGYYPEQLPYWGAYQIPFVFDTPAEAIEISTRSFNEFPYFKDELGRMGLHFLMQQPLGSYYLTGKTADCATVAGLEGKKLRSFGAYVPKIYAAVGGVPVSISTGEVYEGLQRGVVDFAFLSRAVGAASRWYEVAKYNCGPVMSIAGHIVVIGEHAWNKLPEDIQAIFTEESAKYQQEYVEWLEDFEGEAAQTIEANGGEFIAIPEDQMDLWKSKSPDLLAQWVSDMKARGQGEGAEAVAARWREMLGN